MLVHNRMKISAFILTFVVIIASAFNDSVMLSAQNQSSLQSQQNPASQPAFASPDQAGGLPQALLAGPPTLGPIWRDEEDGFQIRPPDGCIGYYKSLADLAHFENPTLKWDIIIHLSKLAQPADVDPLMQEVLAEVRHQFRNVVVLQQNRLYVSGRRAGLLVLRLESIINKTPVDLIWQQVFIQENPTTYFVLTFSCPPDQEADARDIFTRMIGSFQLLDVKKMTQERVAAIQTGRTWLPKQTAESLLPSMDAQPQLFRIVIHGQDAGYVQLSDYPGEKDGFKGIFCDLNSRTFLPDGSMLFSESNWFWAFAQQPGKTGAAANYSSWIKILQHLTPINNPRIVALRQERQVEVDPLTRTFKTIHIDIPYPNMIVHWQTELGIQQSGYFPLLDKNGNVTDAYQFQCRIHVERDYDLGWLEMHPTASESNGPYDYTFGSDMAPALPPALEFLWPRLVNLNTPSEMAFLVFDSDRSVPNLRVLKVLGPEKITIGSQQVQAYHLSEELDPSVCDLWVDASGHLLKYQAADDSVWLPTTQDQMSALWARQLAEINEK